MPTELVVEDPARHVQKVAHQRVPDGVADGRPFLAGDHHVLRAEDGELLRHRRLVNLQRNLELLHTPVVAPKDFENADPQRVGERLEEVRLEGLEVKRPPPHDQTLTYLTICIVRF